MGLLLLFILLKKPFCAMFASNQQLEIPLSHLVVVICQINLWLKANCYLSNTNCDAFFCTYKRSFATAGKR